MKETDRFTLAFITELESALNSYIWKTIEGRQRLEAWYAHFQAKVDADVETLRVPTQFGDSQVIRAGKADGVPLVCLHAMRTGAAYLLSELGPILQRNRVIAPDLPGQSIHGLDARLSLSDDSHARWLIDILDHLKIEQADLFGVSWGGFVARLSATEFPGRFRKLMMLVPAGIANGSHLTGMAKMMWPMIRYRARPTESNLRRLLAPILTTWDDDWASSIACSLRDMKFDSRIPPLASDEDLRRLHLPTLVLAADQDISFPGQAVVERVTRLMPHADAELILNCKHCPPTTSDFRRWLGHRTMTFLDE